MIKDITEEWNSAVAYADQDPMWSNSPNDSIDWKKIRCEGYTHVQIGSAVHEFNKWGLGEFLYTIRKTPSPYVIDDDITRLYPRMIKHLPIVLRWNNDQE